MERKGSVWASSDSTCNHTYDLGFLENIIVNQLLTIIQLSLDFKENEFQKMNFKVINLLFARNCTIINF